MLSSGCSFIASVGCGTSRQRRFSQRCSRGAVRPGRWRRIPPTSKRSLVALWDRTLVRLNENVPGDTLLSALNGDATVSAKALVGTGLVNNTAALHGSLPVGTAALGRALLGAVLLAHGKEENERVQIEFRGDGPLRTVVSIADSDGRARGYLGDPLVHLPVTDAGKLDVGRAIGRGFLTVVRSHPSWSVPYRGITQIVSGEVADDILHYLVYSEQVPSALALGVFLKEGEVAAAGGYLVQMLPGASEATMQHVEKNVLRLNALGSPTQLVRDGFTPQAMLEQLLEGMDMHMVGEARPCYACTCSRSKVERLLTLLPHDEVMSVLREQQQFEGTCEFCGATYRISANEAAAIADRARNADDAEADESRSE